MDPHCTRLRVRFSEIDSQGIVFNSRYLEYIDVAMTEFMRSHGISVAGPARNGNFETALVKATVEYLGSAVLDQEIDVCTRLRRVGTKSFTLDIEICPAGSCEPVLVRAEMVYVNYSVADRAAHPIPETVRAALKGE